MRSKHARAGVAMALATFTMATTSGIQALLYLRTFGVDGRTDGFFAALGLYAIFGVFSQCIRVTSVPLLVGDKPRLLPIDFAACLVVIAVPVLALTVLLAGPVAQALAPGLSDADRAITEQALPIMGLAMVLQLGASGAATVLAVRDRFHAVARAYMIGGVTALATYLLIEGAAAELALGWSMLAMAVATFTVMLSALELPRAPRAGLRRLASTFSLRALLRRTGLILGRNAVYLVFNGLYVVTLALTSRFEQGDASVLAYAYLFVSYLVAGTGFALGMSRIPDMTRGAREDWSAVLAETVAPGYRYAMLFVAPALTGFVAIGAPLAGEVFPSSLGSTDTDALGTFGALLSAWTVAAVLVNLLLPALFALGRARLVNALALPVLALHVLASIIAGALWNVEGVVGAFFVAPLTFAVVLLVAGAGRSAGQLAGELIADTLRFGTLAVAAFGAGAAVGTVAADPLVSAILATAVGSILYVLGAAVAARRQVTFLLASLRPRRRRRELPLSSPAA